MAAQLIKSLIIVSFLVIVASKGETPFDRQFKKMQKSCEDTVCELVPLGFESNCVNQCTSPICFKKHFVEPLEDGEVNAKK